MESEYIGRPKNFHYMQGSEAINFRKTFDLNGTQNDEMLRLYLRKAGLSDEIECLTVEQRRAFIYDIIKSNKMPGYWIPSTMKNSAYKIQRPKMQPPPPPPLPTSSVPSSPYFERRNPPSSPIRNYGTMRSSISAGNLQRFVPAPATPPSPSTFVTSSKGKQYEISGPLNFQHTAGDMNRDMTRNAFDLTTSSNDNVLRKYMMERGIDEEDVAGMRKTDLIRKIVQSKFSWMPSKKNKSSNKANTTSASNLRLNYATISGYPDNTKTPRRPALNIPPSPTTPNSKSDFSNFTLVTSRFTDVRQFPSPDELNRTNAKPSSEIGVIPLPPLPPGTQLPAPPPRKSQYSSASLPTIKRIAPPPPLVIAAQPTLTRDYDNNFEFDPLYMTLRDQKPNEPDYATVDDARKIKNNNQPPPTPPKPSFAKTLPSPPIKVGKGKIPLPPPPPPPLMGGMGKVQTTPPISSIPPPPPPMASLANSSQIAKANVMPLKTNGRIPPPPAPPMAALEIRSVAQHIQQDDSKKSALNSSEDSRDAFLESIRKGVNLKKVNQKSATISGVKPRAERRPQITDFLTELKMGVTSRRMKNPEDNPFKGDEANEWND